MSKKRASRSQIELLVSRLEERPSMSTGRHQGDGRIHNELAWSSLATELNAIGLGSVKTGEKWQQAWRDLRNNIKRKALGLKEEMARNGGGSSGAVPLTPLEERVLVVLGAEKAYGLGCEESTSNISITDSKTPPSSPEVEVEVEEVYVAPSPKKNTDEAVPLASTPNREPLSTEERFLLVEESRVAREAREKERWLHLEERRLYLEERRDEREERQEAREERRLELEERRWQATQELLKECLQTLKEINNK